MLHFARFPRPLRRERALASQHVTALADLPLLASGKVREIYELGDTLLHRRLDRISTYDVVHPTPIPDKGNVLTGLSTFWFERTGDDRPQPPDLRHRRRPRGGPRARHGGPQARRCSRSSASCAATSAARAGRTTSRPARSAGSSCPPGCASPTGCPSRSSRRPPRPTSATTRTIDFEGAVELVGDREPGRAAARRLDRALRARRRRTRARAGSSSPTRSSSSASTRTAR